MLRTTESIRQIPMRCFCPALLLSVLLLPAGTASAMPDPGQQEGQEEKKDRKPEAPDTPPAPGEGKKATETAPPRPPTFGELIELNGAAIFGGDVKVRGEQLEITFNRKGQMVKGFTGDGIHDEDSDLLKGANRRFIGTGGGGRGGGRGGRRGGRGGGEVKVMPGLAALGYEKGLWVSRFPLKGNTRLEFGFRLPNLISSQSRFSAIINWDPKKRSGYQTSFFQSVGRISGGRVSSQRMTRIKQYRRPPNDWFPRKGESVPIEFGIEEGACTVAMSGNETVSYPVKKDTGGHVSFVFNNIVFTFDNLVITGDMDREWCGKEIERLRKSGELIDRKPATETEEVVTPSAEPEVEPGLETEPPKL